MVGSSIFEAVFTHCCSLGVLVGLSGEVVLSREMRLHILWTYALCGSHGF